MVSTPSLPSENAPAPKNTGDPPRMCVQGGLEQRSCFEISLRALTEMQSDMRPKQSFERISGDDEHEAGRPIRFALLFESSSRWSGTSSCGRTPLPFSFARSAEVRRRLIGESNLPAWTVHLS